MTFLRLKRSCMIWVLCVILKTYLMKDTQKSFPACFYIIYLGGLFGTLIQSVPLADPFFDGSCPTNTGFSLNDVLAKGKNTMNKLLEVVIRWLIRRCAYHTDLQNMYNRGLLEPEHWCYQLYYFHSELEPEETPKLKVIKTLIYGIKSSGNQAERGTRGNC